MYLFVIEQSDIIIRFPFSNTGKITQHGANFQTGGRYFDLNVIILRNGTTNSINSMCLDFSWNYMSQSECSVKDGVQSVV